MSNESLKFATCFTPDEVAINKNEFLSELKDPKNWSTIPLLNYTPLHELKDLSVVRFRGMIQDMLDPEIYLERYQVDANGVKKRLQEGKYRDCLVLGPEEEVNYDDLNVHGERRTLFLVSIPGVNSWASTFEADFNRENQKKSEQNQQKVHSAIGKCGSAKKRSINDVDNSPMEINDIETEDSTDGNKRQCQANLQVNKSPINNALGVDYLLNSPIPERPGKACMLKIYTDLENYSLNTIVDVVGFLSVDPALDATTSDIEMASEYGNINEIHAQNPPPSLIPRLHAVEIHKLTHLNPLLDEHFLGFNSLEQPMNMMVIQKELRILLKLCLFGDELAAEYLLSHLISTVYNRSELESVGKFSLNICNIPKEALNIEYTRKIYKILELLLPASHYFSMTLENLNSAQFFPKKDYETNKLVSGVLQLAPHTQLVLDETQMHQGKLEASGVRGIQSIAHLIRTQQIKCDFKFYEIDYNMDVSVLILSEGKSMLPNDSTLPLEVDPKEAQILEESLKAAHHFLHPARLTLFRRYLTVAKTKQFGMKSEVSEMVQNDFVEMRKANSISGPEDLHSLLVLSRLLSIARGQDDLNKESWEMAKEMEHKRKTRIKDLPQSNKGRF